MTTLHGREIKVGDMVWSLFDGWIEVLEVGKDETFPILTSAGNYKTDGKMFKSDAISTLYWEEMMLIPKPQQVYEWKWLHKYRDDWGLTSGHYKTEEEARASLGPYCTDFSPFEPSKREVKL